MQRACVCHVALKAGILNLKLIEENNDYHYKKLKTLHKIEAGAELTLKYSIYDICNYL